VQRKIKEDVITEKGLGCFRNDPYACLEDEFMAIVIAKILKYKVLKIPL
jgi:hypothetical protein